MLYEQGYHNHSGYANIRIHCLTAFQPMNAENIASHCNHGKNLGQFDCRAFRNYILQEVRSAGNYVSKGKRSQKSSTQKDDLQIHSICSLPLGFFFFFLRLGLPEEVLSPSKSAVLTSPPFLPPILSTTGSLFFSGTQLLVSF